MRSEIRFLRRGRRMRLTGSAPTLTLLDYLRLTEHAVGSGEGCAEGDCGACTVVLRKRVDDRLSYEPVNACRLLAGQADGTEVITAEDLGDGAGLHPVQQQLAVLHASQCGFCTPGFVMALFALYHTPPEARVHRRRVNDWIAGNLCRGYRPIVDAALASCGASAADRFTAQEREVVGTLGALADADDLFVGSDSHFFAAPTSLEGLATLYAAHPDAVLVASVTDVDLGITRKLQELPQIIWLGRVRGLDAIEDAPDAVTFGAMASHEAAIPHLAAIDPRLGALTRRFAGRQSRTIGTIVNGSPGGDTLPALIAMGATLTLQRDDAQRRVALEDSCLAYGKQDRGAAEFVRSLRVPKLKPNERFHGYRISKRFDQDPSAVMGAFKFVLSRARIEAARIAFGGMAATPKRARRAEVALAGADLTDETTWLPALAALEQDVTPITDQRTSASYRRAIARALLRKALIEVGGTPVRETRPVGIRETADATA